MQSLKVFAIVFIVMLFVASAYAAQRQCVIIDAFTQWNCPPCATWNPTERSVLNAMTRDTVISIKTHGWWPGSNNDAFHLYNVPESTARINYYGVNAVPTGYADGIVNFGQSATTLRNAVRSRYATASPCTIDNLIAETSSPTGIQVSGTITAEQTLTGAYLYVVLIRDEVTYASPPGSNGETFFPDIFTDASPNFNVGTLINASPGFPFEFATTLVRDPSWDVENLTVIAFAQRNSNREILQGAWTNVLQPYAFTTTNDNPAQAVIQPAAGEQAYLVQLNNIGTMDDSYTVTLDGNWPTGWVYSVEENGGASNPTSINVSLNGGESTFLIVRANPNTNAGSTEFSLTIESHNNDENIQSYSWRLMAGLDVLVIDGDGGETYETYYAAALDAVDETINVVWGWWDASLDEVDVNLFEGVDVLVWFTGNQWQETLTPLDQLNLQDYLENGGKLMLTGQGIGFDMRNDQFFIDYMHAQYLRNFPIGTGVTGLAGTVGDGLNFTIVSGTGANNQNRQSAIATRNEQATLMFNYVQEYQGQTQGAGLTVDNGNYRILYLAFGFEAISTEQNRNAMMERAIGWLLYGTTSSPETPQTMPTEFSLLQNYPNPFNPETTIPFALPVRSNVTLKVFDLLGREVATLANRSFEAGLHSVSWNGSDLSSGVYFYTLKAENGEQSFSSTRKLVLMK
ncbi:T9SS type A sorting domain-containing protein [bacterium]|nr:T9SS type A sorting domain-containing protein [bacterium]